jgi:hypothetical protein
MVILKVISIKKKKRFRTLLIFSIRTQTPKDIGTVVQLTLDLE